MAIRLQNQEGVSEEHLRKQLAAAVRSIQWSYAIFWATSTSVLKWTDGYYNGDIKTRKMTQPMQLESNHMDLQRSEQLRELYVSLSSGDIDRQTKRPSASLSPEDLTDLEWYYLVCMSFTFSPGQGLPGRTLTSGHYIWVTDAHFADSKIFSRSLLAKSASVQTVVCFPFMGGVLELGSTEMVLEDPDLLKQLTTSFPGFLEPVASEQPLSSHDVVEEDEDHMPSNLDHEVSNTLHTENLKSMTDCQTQSECGPAVYLPKHHSDSTIKVTQLNEDRPDEMQEDISEELKTSSPDYSSDDCCPNQHTDDSVMMEGLNGTSQVQSWHFMDEECGNGLHVSLNSSDCVCHSVADCQKIISFPKGEHLKCHLFHDLQDCYHSKLSSLSHDAHYARTLLAIFRNPHQLTVVPCFSNALHTSSFRVWRRGADTPKPHAGTQQNILKKILFNVALMHGGSRLLKPIEENGLKNSVWKSEGDDNALSHILLDRRSREKLNEKFLVLRSIVPSISKVDKASILGDTIEYLKELEKRVDELESCRELSEFKAEGRRKYLDMAERTSDNYCSNEIICGGNHSRNKRKTCDIGEPDVEHHWILLNDGSTYVSLTMIEKEVLIEMHCPWRNCLLTEVVDAISNLHLDAHSVQSSTVDGILTLTIKSKFKSMVVASPGMIQQALQRVIGKC